MMENNLISTVSVESLFDKINESLQKLEEKNQQDANSRQSNQPASSSHLFGSLLSQSSKPSYDVLSTGKSEGKFEANLYGSLVGRMPRRSSKKSKDTSSAQSDAPLFGSLLGKLPSKSEKSPTDQDSRDSSAASGQLEMPRSSQVASSEKSNAPLFGSLLGKMPRKSGTSPTDYQSTDESFAILLGKRRNTETDQPKAMDSSLLSTDWLSSGKKSPTTTTDESDNSNSYPFNDFSTRLRETSLRRRVSQDSDFAPESTFGLNQDKCTDLKPSNTSLSWNKASFDPFHLSTEEKMGEDERVHLSASSNLGKRKDRENQQEESQNLNSASLSHFPYFGGYRRQFSAEEVNGLVAFADKWIPSDGKRRKMYQSTDSL